MATVARFTAWFRLPKLRKIAPEFFDDLETNRSYTALGLHFVFAGAEAFEANFNAETHRNATRFVGQGAAED